MESIDQVVEIIRYQALTIEEISKTLTLNKGYIVDILFYLLKYTLIIECNYNGQKMSSEDILRIKNEYKIIDGQLLWVVNDRFQEIDTAKFQDKPLDYLQIQINQGIDQKRLIKIFVKNQCIRCVPITIIKNHEKGFLYFVYEEYLMHGKGVLNHINLLDIDKCELINLDCDTRYHSDEIKYYIRSFIDMDQQWVYDVQLMVLKENPQAIEFIKERLWYSGKFSFDLEGNLFFEGNVRGYNSLRRLIRQWGPYVKVLGPDKLVKATIRSYQRKLENYRR